MFIPKTWVKQLTGCFVSLNQLEYETYPRPPVLSASAAGQHPDHLLHLLHSTSTFFKGTKYVNGFVYNYCVTTEQGQDEDFS